jgi:hypothetical protein
LVQISGRRAALSGLFASASIIAALSGRAIHACADF